MVVDEVPRHISESQFGCVWTDSTTGTLVFALDLCPSQLGQEKDGVLRLAERFYIEGNSPSPVHFTAFAEFRSLHLVRPLGPLG